MKHITSIKKILKTANVGLSTSNTLLTGMYNNTSKGLTDNGAVTYTRSGSNLLDFYAQAGAMRNNKEGALDLFKKAFAEDRVKAVRILFYLRDVRGGQGERALFRSCLEWLGTDVPEVFEKIVNFVPEYGRYDDLFFDNEKCFDIIKAQVKEDYQSETPSLLAKWMPTINASSQTTRAKARFMANKIGLTEVGYRKTLREIRKKIKTVEEKMSARKWEEIEYSSVPSQAARIYKDAFKKHDDVRYSEFIGKAVKGEVKIQTSTLYPYQIYNSVNSNYSQTLEALWNQLPDYTRGNNALVVADVSGSMSGDPMSVAVSLALYFAERNKGQFKDHFITFSAEPKLQRIVGETLLDKMNSIERSKWDMNTNIEKVFSMILNTATSNNVNPEEMPSTIYIISDMQFDGCCVWGDTAYESFQKKYQAAGYEMPSIVFWQVNSTSSNLPVQKDQRGVAMVSGFSPVIFKMAVENKSPEEVMNDTINSERYAKIFF